MRQWVARNWSAFPSNNKEFFAGASAHWQKNIVRDIRERERVRVRKREYEKERLRQIDVAKKIDIKGERQRVNKKDNLPYIYLFITLHFSVPDKYSRSDYLSISSSDFLSILIWILKGQSYLLDPPRHLAPSIAESKSNGQNIRAMDRI